jgi:thiamine biosynthesis lipoprotein
MSKMCIDLAKPPLGRLPLIRQTLSGATMGTRYSAVFYMPFGTNVAALNAAVSAAVDRVDREMSSWKAESDLNRLNAAPEGVWVDIPRELMTVLEASQQIECVTNGAFDIGVG